MQRSFVLWQIISYLPNETVIVGVVDPKVGTTRRRIKSRRHYLVVPDNGLLIPAPYRDGVEKIMAIKPEKIQLRRFHLHFMVKIYLYYQPPKFH